MLLNQVSIWDSKGGALIGYKKMKKLTYDSSGAGCNNLLNCPRSVENDKD